MKQKLKSKIKRYLRHAPLADYVVFSLVIVLVYTITELIISTISGISHDTLTTCVFALFGTEIGSCAFIKVYKLKEGE